MNRDSDATGADATGVTPADPTADDPTGAYPTGADATTADPLAGLHGEADCSAILARMHEFLDHELDGAASDAIRAHLAACEHCLDDFDVVHALKEVVSRCCRAEKAPQQLRVTIVTSITRWRAG